MHFFATSAQIASDFHVSHSDVMETVDSLPYTEFVEQNVTTFEVPSGNAEVPSISIAQVTEPGFNAIVFHLPLTEDSSEKIMEWREQFFHNKAPTLNTGTTVAPTAQPAKAQSKGRIQINDATRRKAEDAISNGTYDNIVAATFADIHRKISADFGEDPGYQNVRQYVINRRGQLNINL